MTVAGAFSPGHGEKEKGAIQACSRPGIHVGEDA